MPTPQPPTRHDRAPAARALRRWATLALFALAALAAASVGALAWHHLRLADPCPAVRAHDGEPVVCRAVNW